MFSIFFVFSRLFLTIRVFCAGGLAFFVHVVLSIFFFLRLYL